MELSLVVVNLIVFVMACFVGYHVIWGVTPALHTPLMSVTNAISGVVVVGAMVVAGMGLMEGHSFMLMGAEISYAKVIGFLAVFFASVNIFGGFAVTARMLAMYKKKDK